MEDNNMIEEWKVLKKTQQSIWEISNYGNIKRNGELYYPEIEGGIYLRKDGSITGRKRFCLGRVHRLVWETFNGPIPKGYDIDHIDTNGLNNRLDNLRIVTHKENMNNPISVEHASKAKQKENHPMWGKKQKESTIEKRKQYLYGNNFGSVNKGRIGPNRNKHREYNTDGTYKYIYNS